MIELWLDSVWIILMGLGMDIAGACLIVSPLLKLVKTNYPDGTPKGSEMGMVDMKHGFNQDVESQRRAKVGLSLLIFGFILQGAGNYLQYLQTLL